MDWRDLLRHILATLAFRLQYAVSHVPDGFAGFDAGEGVRTPEKILNHMILTLAAAHDVFHGRKPEFPDPLPWPQAIVEVHRVLMELDHAIADDEAPSQETVLRLLQGPICDTLTHVGQLMMLRRMAGAPLEGIVYFRSEIKPGQVGTDQPLPHNKDS